MGGLWPSRTAESDASEAGGSSNATGSIEMKGSKRSSGAPFGHAIPSSFWPVTSLRGRAHSREEILPLAENCSRPAAGSGILEPAFLEAVVEANTATLLTCSPRGVEISPRSREDAKEGASSPPSSSISISVAEPSGDEQQEFQEVQMVFRVPRFQPGNAAGDSSKQAFEALQEDLALKERQRRRAADSLASKTQECEDLLRIIRELTASRNKLASFKAIQVERLVDLQHDYMRLGRVAELSRAVSKENIKKSQELTERLHQAEEELARQKLLSQQTSDRYMRLKLENLELREKICLLERLDLFAYQSDSACMVEFKQIHLKETY